MDEKKKNNLPPLKPSCCLAEECLFHIKRKDDHKHYCKFDMYPYNKTDSVTSFTYKPIIECPMYIDKDKVGHDDRSIRRQRAFAAQLLYRIKEHPEEFKKQFLCDNIRTMETRTSFFDRFFKFKK